MQILLRALGLSTIARKTRALNDTPRIFADIIIERVENERRPLRQVFTSPSIAEDGD